MKREFSREIFEFSPNISPYVVQCGKTDRERGGHYKSKLTVLVSHYKFAAHLQKSCEISSSILTGSGADIILLSVRSTQLHTQSIG